MKKRAMFAIILMGSSSLFIQTLVIRESLASFYGNELTIGIILANWILPAAIGSLIAGRYGVKNSGAAHSYACLQIITAAYLPVAIFLLRIVKNLLGLTPGEGTGLAAIFSSSLLILLPLGLAAGAQFPCLCRMLSQASSQPQDSGARTYILEAVGFIVAGPLFICFLAARFDSFSIAFILGMLGLFSAMLLLNKAPAGLKTKCLSAACVVLFALCALALLIAAGPLQEASIKHQYPALKVLKYENSLYGNLCVARNGAQYTFFSDGIPVITTPTPDIAYVQDMAHFAMLSCSDPRNILLLGGAAGGIINEALKYPAGKMTYVELDPLLIRLLTEFPSDMTLKELNDSRVAIKYTDASLFLRYQSPKQAFDVIILNLPMPSTLQLNRFYTEEFFRAAKTRLKAGGVLALSLPGSLSYMSPQMRSLNSCVLNTIKKVFSVTVIPGYYNIYLATDDKLTLSPELIMERLKRSGAQVDTFNSAYLRERLSRQWQEFFNNSLEGYNTPVNSDLMPSAVFYGIAQWNSAFSVQTRGLLSLLGKIDINILIAVLLCILLILLIARAKRKLTKRAVVGYAIMGTGFTAMALNLILFYAYQAFCGFLFMHIALLSAAFMTGLALGGWLGLTQTKKCGNTTALFMKMELALILFPGVLMASFYGLTRHGLINTCVMLFLLSALCGALAGMEFPVANKIWQEEKPDSPAPGTLYSLDLAGAFLAAVATSVVLMPVVGIMNSCLLLLALKASTLILLLA